MTVIVPPPSWSSPIVDERGFPTRWFAMFVQALYGAIVIDLRAATATANAAAPGTSLVVASGGLKQGGQIGGNAAVALYAAVTTVALLPAGGMAEGDWAYALDGRKVGEGAGAGTGVPALFSRGHWVAVDSGATVAA